MELKLSNLSRKHVKNTTWPKEKKIQAVAQYLALGNMRLVAATTGVDYGVLRQWKLQPWWKEYEIEIRNTENIKLDSGMTKIVERSLDVISDRLENGDFVYDQKSGEMRRKPVQMKDAAKVSVDLLTKRELLRGNATARTETTAVPVEEQLRLLALEFARMTGKGVIDVEAEVIEDVRSASDEATLVHDIRDADQVQSDDLGQDGEEVDNGPLGGERGSDSGEGGEDSDLVSDPEGLPRNDNP